MSAMEPAADEKSTGAAHTSLPWRVDPAHMADIIGGDGRDVAETTLSVGYRRPPAEQLANAAFIVTACNSHHDLLEALKDLVANFDAGPGSFVFDKNWASQCSAAIARATSPVDAAGKQGRSEAEHATKSNPES